MGQGVLNTSGWREAGEMADTAALMDDAGLTREGGDLRMAGVSLDAVAARVGTPAYVYNAEAIRRQYERLDAALAAVPHRICFAVKANGNLAVLRVLRDLGAGADIVSQGEMHRVLAAGFDPGRIVFSGVGKTRVELDAAVAAQLGHVNLESEAELDALAAVAKGANREVRVGIRVNPDVTADTHPFISTGGRGIKFGIPADQVVAIARRVAATPGLRLTGLAMHLGSQLLDPEPYQKGLARLTHPRFLHPCRRNHVARDPGHRRRTRHPLPRARPGWIQNGSPPRCCRWWHRWDSPCCSSPAGSWWAAPGCC